MKEKNYPSRKAPALAERKGFAQKNCKKSTVQETESRAKQKELENPLKGTIAALELRAWHS